MKKLASVLLLALAGCSTPGYVDHGVPNLRTISPGEYRGGQPLDSNAWVYIFSLGVSNVVKLNLESEGSDAPARALGMTVNYYPIDTLHQTVLKPSAVLVSNAVAVIRPGTYVHCEHGEDRTGLIVGCKRVWVDQWRKEAAREEMLKDGFHKELHGLNDFWEDDVH